jgi:hypothetical protein
MTEGAMKKTTRVAEAKAAIDGFTVEGRAITATAVKIANVGIKLRMSVNNQVFAKRPQNLRHFSMRFNRFAINSSSPSSISNDSP